MEKTYLPIPPQVRQAQGGFTVATVLLTLVVLSSSHRSRWLPEVEVYFYLFAIFGIIYLLGSLWVLSQRLSFALLALSGSVFSFLGWLAILPVLRTQGAVCLTALSLLTFLWVRAVWAVHRVTRT